MSAQYEINFNKHGVGFVVNEVAGENLGLHKLVYRNAAGTWSLADADAVATMPVLGITMGQISSGKKGEILLWGYIGDNLTWAWTLAQPIYASTVAGELTQTMPAGIGDVVQVVAMPINDPTMIQFIGSVGAAVGGSNTLEGETAFVGFDNSKSHFVNYFLCDGVADDVQINAATTYVNGLGGGTVFVEAGIYSLDATINLYSNIWVKGNGYGGGQAPNPTCTTFTSAANIDFFTGQGAVGGALLGVRLSDFEIDGTGNTGDGVWFDGVGYAMLWNIYIHNCVNGYEHRTDTISGNVPMIHNLIIKNCSSQGIIFSGVSDGIIGDCDIGGNGTNILFSGCSFFLVNNVHLYSASGRNLTVFGGNNFFVNNFIFGGSVSNSIYVYSSASDVIITNGKIDNGGAGRGQIALRVQDVTSIEISNLIIEDYVSGSISLESVSEATVSHNVFDDELLVLGTGADVDISHNIIDSGGTYHIDIQAATVTGTRVFDNIFLGAGTKIRDSGTDTVTPELPIYVKDPDGNIGTHPAVVLSDGADITVYDQLQIPLGFQELVTAEIIIVPAAGGNMRRSAASNWGKIGSGEAYNAQTDTIAAGQVAVDADDLEAIDISTLFTAIAAGDQIGFTFTREGSDVNDTINDDCYYLGGRIRYV